MRPRRDIFLKSAVYYGLFGENPPCITVLFCKIRRVLRYFFEKIRRVLR
jgi:hypothetical protein